MWVERVHETNIASKNEFNQDDFEIESKLTINEITMKSHVLGTFGNLWPVL